MNSNFERVRRDLPAQDLESFVALCLNRADTCAAPYSALVAAPQIESALTALDIMARAGRETAEAIEALYRTDSGSGAELFARALGKLLEAPGRVPTLISTNFPDRWDWFEINIARERGGAFDSTFTGTFGCGLTRDTYHFAEDAFGPGSSVSFSIDYLTDYGLEFALWLLPSEIDALRMRELKTD